MSNFHVFFVGPRKTGTTRLYEVLRSKPIQMTTKVKEIFYFEQPEPDLEAYQTDFGIDPQYPFCEISPSYFTSNTAIDNISRLFPSAKIIITLRQPVSRAMSALKHVRRIGMLPENPDYQSLGSIKQIKNILNGSYYTKHILKWSAAFPGGVLVIKQNSVGQYSDRVIEKLEEFLGVKLDPHELNREQSNPARSARSRHLVKLARWGKTRLQKFGAYDLIRFFKPLEKVLFRPYRESDVDSRIKDFFEEQLVNEVLYYDSLPEADWKNDTI